MRRPWQEIAQEAQDHRDASIALIRPGLPELPAQLPKCVVHLPDRYLSEPEVQITNLLPEELLRMLAAGDLTATAVTRAFLRRAGIAQQLTNCVTELLPEQAIARAQYLDEYFAMHQKPLGPLHGLPISVKEHMGMKGLRLNGGYIASWDRIADEDAHILQILWRAGAVFHARTTQPQSVMHLETDSNLYGVTVNPYNSDTSAGGSSGGEGALIGLRGSCLGIGSDIGGSIRSPAANNGIYGFKPTAYRLPTQGWAFGYVGADAIPTVIGPLSTSLEGLKLLVKTIIDAKPWLIEPALFPLHWEAAVKLSPEVPLKVGVLWHDGVVTPHPPITRALNSVVNKLSTLSNATIVNWEPHKHDYAWSIISSLYFTDGGEEDLKMMAASGEPLRPLTKWIMTENPHVKNLSAKELRFWQEERESYRKDYADLWNSTAHGQERGTGGIEGAVDVILCPAGPGVAPQHDTARYWGYTSQWNLLDYPALVFPVSKVDSKIDIVDSSFEPMTDADKDNWKLYEPDVFDGLPISLQLVGRRFEDEKVIAVMEYIKQSIGLPFVEFP